MSVGHPVSSSDPVSTLTYACSYTSGLLILVYLHSLVCGNIDIMVILLFHYNLDNTIIIIIVLLILQSHVPLFS